MLSVGFSACFGAKRDMRTQLAQPVNIIINAAPTSVTFVNNDRTDEYEELEVSIDGTNWQGGTTITGLTPNTSYTAYARYKENEVYKASDSWTKAFTTPKHGQDAPAVSFSQADKTVTFDPGSALEYSFDGGTTYSADNEHTYTENGEKTVKVRYKETDEKYKSAEQIIDVYISDFYGGFGTEEDPFLISTLEHFYAISTVAHYKLIADIDFSSSSAIVPVDIQSFDGNGYKIINPIVAGAGIFRSVGEVKNLTVENAVITFAVSGINNEYNIGIIAGRAQVVSNCKANGEITITDTRASGQSGYVGGLVGRTRIVYGLDEYKVVDSYADVDIRYNSSVPSNPPTYNTQLILYVGGLFGADERSINVNDQITVSESAAKVDIELLGTYGAYVGGITGYMQGNVSNCYATGTITTGGSGGNIFIGGIAATLLNSSINSCYAAMNIGASGLDQNALWAA
jgi:hypothetical protein